MREKWSEKKTQINNHECLLYQTPTKLQRNEREEKNHECIGIEYSNGNFSTAQSSRVESKCQANQQCQTDATKHMHPNQAKHII